MTSNSHEPVSCVAEMGLTRPEFALLNAVHFGMTLSGTCPGIAVHKDSYAPGAGVTESECQVALASCLTKGWLQIIDEAALADITEGLRADGVLGPVYGLPKIQGVDFTPAGADLWRRLYDQCFPDRGRIFVFTDVVHRKRSQYFRTKSAALTATADVHLKHVVNRTHPVRIGPWRLQWWRCFPEGYRVDTEIRMKWQGDAGTVGAAFTVNRYARKTDAVRLRDLLDRHNVAFAAWLLFCTIDGDWCTSPDLLPRFAAESHAEQFGEIASVDECCNALETCLSNGWLRTLDDHGIEKIQLLMRRSPVFIPLPNKVLRRRGEIDFTRTGATLYRLLSTEWLGADWEDSLSVWNDYYQEEHYYCESDGPLRGLLQEQMARDAIVRSNKMVPLGPWCVYWWNRFSQGYRLEVKVGDP